MGKTLLKYTFGTIVVYLVIANATNFGKALSATGGLYKTGVKVLQGRA